MRNIAVFLFFVLALPGVESANTFDGFAGPFTATYQSKPSASYTITINGGQVSITEKGQAVITPLPVEVTGKGRAWTINATGTMQGKAVSISLGIALTAGNLDLALAGSAEHKTQGTITIGDKTMGLEGILVAPGKGGADKEGAGKGKGEGKKKKK